MTGPDASERFAIVEIAPGESTENAILIGNLDLLMEQLPDTLARNAAAARLEEAATQVAKTQNDIWAQQIKTLTDGATTLSQRLDQLEARRDARIKAEAQEREAAEQQLIQQRLDELPDPDNPHAWETTGELTPVPASEPIDREQLAAGDAGGVPLSYGPLPLSYVKGEDQGSPVPGEPLPPRDRPSRRELATLAHAPEEKQRPPVAVSLDAE